MINGFHLSTSCDLERIVELTRALNLSVGNKTRERLRKTDLTRELQHENKNKARKQSARKFKMT